MNKYLRVVACTLLLALVLSACGLRVVNGSGHVVSEQRAVSNFTALDFNGLGELTLVHGDNESLTIETDDNLLPYITTTVNQGRLTISLGKDRSVPLLRPSRSIRYTLTVRALSVLDMSGAGTIASSKLTADQLTVRESGAGAIRIDQLTANDIAVEMSGAGKVSLSGVVAHQIVEMSGLGSYEAGSLKSQTAKVTLSGTGTATVWVQEMLDSDLSGMGTINYYGSPRTDASASGIGTLQHLGSKE